MMGAVISSRDDPNPAMGTVSPYVPTKEALESKKEITAYTKSTIESLPRGAEVTTVVIPVLTVIAGTVSIWEETTVTVGSAKDPLMVGESTLLLGLGQSPSAISKGASPVAGSLIGG